MFRKRLKCPPQPSSAPYDPLTAEARALLFHTASTQARVNRRSLKKLSPARFAPTTGKPAKGSPTSRIRLPLRRPPFGIWTYRVFVGVMHDVLEDTGVTKGEMAAVFGTRLPRWWTGCPTEKLKFEDHAEHQAESFRKLILAMTKDVRVIVVKLADRLHNMDARFDAPGQTPSDCKGNP